MIVQTHFSANSDNVTVHWKIGPVNSFFWKYIWTELSWLLFDYQNFMISNSVEITRIKWEKQQWNFLISMVSEINQILNFVSIFCLENTICKWVFMHSMPQK